MLEMRVGLTKVMIKRPRRIDGRILSSVVGRRVEASTERRKTTDSVRETEMEFLRRLINVGVIKEIWGIEKSR
jgi:hypothetical protein